MRRLFAILLLCVLGIFTMPVVASAAGVSPIVNVKYVHDAIRTKWNLDIPYNPNLSSPSAAANMRYVLGMVDRANARFGVETNYGTGEYATSAAANQNTANRAIETLIQKPIEFPFSVTTTPATKTFSFKISASGTFYVDWGDGSDVDEYVKNDTNDQEISHTYTTAGAYTVRLGGRATGYRVNDGGAAAITFSSYRPVPGQGTFLFCDLAGIDGSLGAIFPTLADGTQPRFVDTFNNCSGLTGSIPENLFAGISGAPVSNMFGGTFYMCSGLTGEIPEKLFAGISGAPAERMFFGTFGYCSGLTGGIPEKLFAGISGAPAERMFDITFYDCKGLTGGIPEKLFAGISGAPAERMFFDTFGGCSGLTGEIPVGLFGNLSGAPASGMFYNTFWNCSGLIGKSARNPDGTPLYDVFPTATTFDVGGMYEGTCLDDNASIPEAWGKNPDCVSGGPTDEYPFVMTTTPDTKTFSFTIGASGTFYVDWGDGSDVDEYVKNDTNEQVISHTYTTAGAYTVKLGGLATGYGRYGLGAAITFSSYRKVPGMGLYLGCDLAGIDGSLGAIFPTLADGTQPRFNKTFSACSGLTEIPENLFAGISGAPARAMFSNTFDGCSGLTEIPENLFAGISGAPAEYMFDETFYGCYGLTGKIPENLFAGISGAPAFGMFESTFSACSGLTEIPEKLFAGISGAPAERMFYGTFSGCSGLTGSIPEKLFAGISGAPASSMFSSTFGGCSGLTGTIPENLFAGISGAPASSMFFGTFRDCSGLTEIPENLFAGISGAPAGGMFLDTFGRCSGLTEIPENLFAGISGAPAGSMFEGTFGRCSGLTEIPEKLFAGISGAPAIRMFYGTFRDCTNLTGEIPVGLFGNLSGTPASAMFLETFYNCSGLTGKSARNPDGTPLYDVFPTATGDDVRDMYTGTCLADNASIPDDWGRNASCVYSGPTE